MTAGARVLVVDDDEDIRTLLGITLEVEGFDVRTARHGAHALEVMRSFRPDVILLDVRMPVMDGRRFAAELAGRGEHPAIVVMTAAESAAAEAATIGTPWWIAKPFDIDALVRCLERVA